MAKLMSKENVSKVVFLIPSDVKKKHREVISLAKDLGIRLDFTTDFLRWFNRDLKSTKKMLLEMKMQLEEKK